MTHPAFQGSLFSNDFLEKAIAQLSDWSAIAEAALDRFARDVKQIFGDFPTAQTPNESQTEDDLIWPVLNQLGWAQFLRQQNLAARGRDDIPDGLLFDNQDAKARANNFRDEWKRYGCGLAIVESKRWQRPLDRQSGRAEEETAPSTQMLRYLRRVDDLTSGKLRWGILTNGARWRLYYQGARSVSEQFFEIDLAAVLGIPGHDGGLFTLSEESRRHWLRVFILVFRREAFLPSSVDARTFHQRAIDEGRFYEERVADSISKLVFDRIFPVLAQSIAAAAPAASLQDVREAALILLYRLLFILYAEDRDLLPVRERRYDEYGLRDRVRGDIGRRRANHDRLRRSARWSWEYCTNHQFRRFTPLSRQSRRPSRQFMHNRLRLCSASEGTKYPLELVHRRAASRGAARSLRGRPLRQQAKIIREAVLGLTYTAHDMAPFARDMGYFEKKSSNVPKPRPHPEEPRSGVSKGGGAARGPSFETLASQAPQDEGADFETGSNKSKVKPPFQWDEERRLKLRAKLDAVYFHLYGVTGRDDVRYIYSTFPIVEREEMNAFGRYRSRDPCLAYMNALAAGDPDAEIDL